MLTNNHGNLTKMPKIIEPATINRSSSLISTKIVSDTPGRLRLRIAPSHRQAQKMQRIASILETQPNINQVQTNIFHGSIVINHSGKNGSLRDVLATLKDIGLIIADMTEGSTEASVGVSNAIVDLNKRVKSATMGAVDLRFLFPFGLTILAVRQLTLKGWQLEFIPWYVLAWYAFDSFIKLNGISQPQLNNVRQI